MSEPRVYLCAFGCIALDERDDAPLHDKATLDASIQEAWSVESATREGLPPAPAGLTLAVVHLTTLAGRDVFTYVVRRATVTKALADAIQHTEQAP